MNYGLQLYSIRYDLEKDMPGALRKVAEMGYENVEPAGFFDHSAEEVRQMLTETGLRLSATHSPYKDLRDNFDETLAFHKKLGNRHYIIPGHKMPDQSEIDDFVCVINDIQPRLEAEGIKLSFHNHRREHIMNEDGSVIFEQLLYRTNLSFEVDIYWAFTSMNNPLLLMDRVGDRLSCVHLKDGTADCQSLPLGQGVAPIPEVWEYARKRGIPMVVENTPTEDRGLAEAKICIDCLREIEKKAN